MKIEYGVKFDFQDLLFKPKRSNLSSRSEVDLEVEIKFLHSKRVWKGIPILVANMDTTGTFEMYYELCKYKMITCFHKHYEVKDFPLDLDPNYYAISTGINDKDWNKLTELVKKLNPYFVVIDVANGYSSKFVNFCKKVRDTYPDLTIIAGNIATPDMVQELLLSAKVDVVKCGIGSGSVCSTRLKTGVGYPQVSVCMNCSEVANGLRGHIVSDGGCRLPGDVSKAFGAGAHFVMLGGMLSGHKESGGDLIEENGKKYKIFYGMSSDLAQKKHHGGMASYRSSEGKVKKIPYKGTVNNTIIDLLGGMRSTGTYIGAKRLKDFPKCTTFIQVNRQVNEVYSHPNFDVKDYK
jgi:GMP reductase